MRRAPSTVCLFLTAAVLADGALSRPAAAEWSLLRAYAVENVDDPEKEPAFRSRIEGGTSDVYSGLTAATVPRPELDAEFELYVGVRPRILDVAWDLKYSRQFNEDEAACCGVFALNFDGDIGPDASLRGVVAVDPINETTRAETRATLTLRETYQVESLVRTSFSAADPAADGYVYVDIGATRSFEHGHNERTSVAFRVADTNRAPLSARLTVNYVRRF